MNINNTTHVIKMYTNPVYIISVEFVFIAAYMLRT